MMIPRKDTITMIGINKINKTKKIVTAICTAKYITVATTDASMAAATVPRLPVPRFLLSSITCDNLVCVFILWLSIAVFFCCIICLKFSAVLFATITARPAPVDADAVSAVFAAALPAAFVVSAEAEDAISAVFSPPATVLWERIAARLSPDLDAISPFPSWLPISFLSTGSFQVLDLYFLSFKKISAACCSFS